MGSVMRPLTNRVSSFDPQELSVLCEAFAAAWAELGPLADADNHEQVRTQIAKVILALAEAGQRDKAQLTRYAVAKISALLTWRCLSNRDASIVPFPSSAREGIEHMDFRR